MKRNYVETVDFLFAQLPVFQRDGAAAYKPGLDTIISFCKAIGNPHLKFKSIHVGGTNGKGSSSHMLASILQEQGYKTGLYTSPHLVDFRERIKIDGNKIPESEVVEIIEKWIPLIESLKPSFFELTVALGFHHFAKHKVDIAVIEVGMGGRLDSTNIINPLVSLITNIGLDHQVFLGETHELIAGEKAGIIKNDIPVIISERQAHSDFVFKNRSDQVGSKLQFASDIFNIFEFGIVDRKRKLEVHDLQANEKFELNLSLVGNYQLKNIKGVLAVCKVLNQLGLSVERSQIEAGVQSVQKNTGLLGRWQILKNEPLVICDTGHNEDGIKEVVSQLSTYSYKNLWIIFGMVSDKDHRKIIQLLPQASRIIATQPNLPRALPSNVLADIFRSMGFATQEIPVVQDAIDFAIKSADKQDVVFVGGSTFTVADIQFEKFLDLD